MKKDEEYIITGLFSAVNAPFLYRKASLIAVVGEGGNSEVVVLMQEMEGSECCWSDASQSGGGNAEN